MDNQSWLPKNSNNSKHSLTCALQVGKVLECDHIRLWLSTVLIHTPAEMLVTLNRSEMAIKVTLWGVASNHAVPSVVPLLGYDTSSLAGSGTSAVHTHRATTVILTAHTRVFIAFHHIRRVRIIIICGFFIICGFLIIRGFLIIGLGA